MTTTPPRIPRPPTPEEVDQISRDQSLITDEWAPEPGPQPPQERKDDTPKGSA